jgi:glycerol-3-phosphate acyltransferase PlsY
VAKFKGVNIQRRGSRNTGATNVYRTLGLSYALLVFLLDTLKGVLVMLIVKFSLNSHIEIALVALAVILGHTFSVFLKGKGGKGVATTLGVLLVLIGWKVMFGIVLAGIALLILTRFMSLTNLILIWIFPGYFVFVNPDLAYFVLGVIVTILIYWEHRENIDRLKEGRELKLAIKIGLSSQRPKALPIQTVPSRRLAKIEKPSSKKKTNKTKTLKKTVVKKPKKTAKRKSKKRS